jgi:hypothetical protein
MAESLGGQWVRAGHKLLFAGRSADKAVALAERLGDGASAGDLADAAGFADTVFVAVRREGVLKTLAAAGAESGVFAGKTLIDCTNPIVEAEGFRLATADGPSMATRIAELTGARVAKAFNLCPHLVYAMRPPVFDGVPLGVPFCGEESARPATRELIEAIGADPIDLGGLERAGQIEAVGAVVIASIIAGADPRTMIPPMPEEAARPGEDPAEEADQA